MNRVVVTGLGCVTAIGQDVATFRENLFAGRDGFREIPDVAAGDLRFQRAALIEGFDAASLLTSAQILLSERSSQFALVAAQQAIAQAEILQAVAPEEMAIVFGCSAGGRTAEEPATAKLYTTGGRVHPLSVPRFMGSAGTSLVSIQHGITGPAYTITTACASATHAIGQAFHMVRSGMVKAAMTGGHEAPLTYGFYKAWDSLRVVSQTQCRPFSADRDGMTLGEGAAIFVLETLESAVARGATIYGEIVGFGMSSDASHITQAQPAGPTAAMRRALLDAGAAPEDVGYINAHGTGTTVNDNVEAEAIRTVFAENAANLPLSSTKAMHGHAMGASGAIEALATLLALREGMLPVTAGVAEADVALGLDVIVGEARKASPKLALSNSFAFGGLNAVLAFKPYED
ncbi:beta-ketoacyl-[acyl-carrier-protein] synthase family protein [Terriglobus saanensis]|uniref:Nodulation protein E n=1 Tax=Terriglobus saanensis (strain ATCC BAA-1853 / DSM 23119 / SP1PR4) TaxID=401053 RepID=E8V2B5_TERSS|nr:beta-ketoacyl-[acyl-carrier-protein] synthase family protein [Terriglobus saanensis]ADV81248.1 Beta-ketoacyl synthase [Terriglobus saanensis SP1PR4]